MNNYANRYAVMLDDWIDAFPQHWPISHDSDTLQGALSAGYFDAGPILEPRGALHPELLQSTVMIYTPTGLPYKGAVYLMHAHQS